jgi:ABC-type branched-subunit amino acid transport system substrate-binding protein
MTITTARTTTINNGQIWTGSQAAAGRINSEGGINNHPIQVLTCNDEGNPDKAANCARQAVDEKVAAVIGSFSRSSGSRILPVLEQAGIAYIAGNVVSPEDSTSKIAFPINGSAPVLYAGDALLLIQQGAKRIKILREDVSSQANLERYIRAAIKSKGLTPAGTVIIPSGTTDYAPIVAAATDGADGVVIGVPRVTASNFLKAASSAGIDIKNSVKVAGNANVIDLKILGNYAEGIFIDDFFPAEKTGNAEVDKAYADIRAQPEYNQTDTTSLNSYFGVMVFAQVARTLQTVDAASVLDGLSKTSAAKVAGVTVDFTKENPQPDIRRLFSGAFFVQQVKGGAFVQVGSTPLQAFPLPL